MPHGQPPLTRNPNPYPLPNGYIIRVRNCDGTHTYKPLPARDVAVRAYLMNDSWSRNFYTGLKYPTRTCNHVRHLVHRRIELPADFYQERASRDAYWRQQPGIVKGYVRRYVRRSDGERKGQPLRFEEVEKKPDEFAELARDEGLALPSDRYVPGEGSIKTVGKDVEVWEDHAGLLDEVVERSLGLGDITPSGPEYTVRFAKPKRRRGKVSVKEDAVVQAEVDARLAMDTKADRNDYWASDIEDRDWEIMSAMSDTELMALNSLAGSGVLVEYHSDPES